MTLRTDTIVACATPTGGAIAVIRMSGNEAIAIADRLFRSRSKRSLTQAEGYTAHYGEIVDPNSGNTIDDVVLTLFRAPRSYTGEDSVEISCHGSAYVASRIVQAAIDCGARAATAGEFTTRAFLAGKIDLAQAEGVADMIAATDRATHRLALNQMRGGYSAELQGLRDELLRLGALLELELDFAEEEVEFADRSTLQEIMTTIDTHLSRLIESFSLGNALKEGIATAIVGAPNAGKSTLLNRLLNEDRAMVSDIAGTTRDSIEESIVIGGRRFRVIDTAGIRSTDDRLEQMGIDRTFSSLRRATVVLLVCDCSTWSDHEDWHDAAEAVKRSINELQITDDQKLIVLLNKCDCISKNFSAALFGLLCEEISAEILTISARSGAGIEKLTTSLANYAATMSVEAGDTIVTSARHYEALCNARWALGRALEGLSNALPSDLLSEEIRQVIYHLGTITGEITTDEILGQIFSKFCIGK